MLYEVITFVIDASPLAKDEPELKDFKRVFINPEVTFNSYNFV